MLRDKKWGCGNVMFMERSLASYSPWDCKESDMTESLTYTTFHFMYVSHFVLEKAMAPHSSTLGWKIPWMEEPGRL